MPPFDFLFAELPAEKDDAAVSKMGKIAKPHLEVFHEDTHFLDGVQVGADLLQARYIERTDGTSASILGPGAGFPNILFRSSQYGLGLSDRRQSGIQLRDQVIRLRQGKEAVMFLIVTLGHRRLRQSQI